MGNPYIGEIRMFAGNFAPAGWMFCDGSLLPISEYDALFALIGTNYGGDGQSTFALPDLRGRVPIHQGWGPGLSSYLIGQVGGVERVALATGQLPAHTHTPQGVSGAGTGPSPGGAVWAAVSSGAAYASGPPASPVAMDPPQGTVGGSQPHENMMPFQAISFIIALFGIFPSPS